MRKIIIGIILFIMVVAGSIYSMTINQVDTVWKAGDLVYYAPPEIYDYMQERLGTVPWPPFTGNTIVPSNIIEDTRASRDIVAGNVVTSYEALVDGHWMPISRLYPSLASFKTTLQAAFEAHSIALEARAALDLIYADSVLNIGTSVLTSTESDLDFGSSSTELSLDISNDGDARLNWSALVLPENMASKIDIDPDSGQILNGDDPVTITITVDRSGIPAGDYEATAEFTGDSNAEVVEVSISVP